MVVLVGGRQARMFRICILFLSHSTFHCHWGFSAQAVRREPRRDFCTVWLHPRAALSWVLVTAQAGKERVVIFFFCALIATTVKHTHQWAKISSVEHESLFFPRRCSSPPPQWLLSLNINILTGHRRKIHCIFLLFFNFIIYCKNVSQFYIFQ